MISRALIKTLVDKAFAKVDGLAVTATFSNTKATGFNFNTGQLISTSNAATTRGVITEKRVENSDTVKYTKVLLVRSEGVQYSLYNTVIIDGVNYKCRKLSGDDYITQLELTDV